MQINDKITKISHWSSVPIALKAQKLYSLTMIDKKVIYLIFFFFIASGGMLTPVFLPYISLEKQQPFQPQLDPLANPEALIDYSKALKDQTDRNIIKLEKAQTFNRWFVVSFTVFIISSLLLIAVFICSLLGKSANPFKIISVKGKKN